MVGFGLLKVLFLFDAEHVLSGSACIAHADFMLFALLRDWVSGWFNCIEENSGKMAESGMKFFESQSKNLAWKKLYNIYVVQVS